MNPQIISLSRDIIYDLTMNRVTIYSACMMFMINSLSSDLVCFNRDTTVQTLTLQPSVRDGIIIYEDSPLVSIHL